MAIETRITMIDITIKSSMSVNPKWSTRRRGDRAARQSPLCIRSPISRFLGALGIDVEDVLAAPAGRLRVVLHAALSPVGRVGHGIFRDSAQEPDFLVHLPGEFDAVD